MNRRTVQITVLLAAGVMTVTTSRPAARAAGRAMAIDDLIGAVTGQTLPNVWVGAFVPGSGDRDNGMMTSSDPRYKIGFMAENGIHGSCRGRFVSLFERRCTSVIPAHIGTVGSVDL
jgi:hypothetical protein